MLEFTNIHVRVKPIVSEKKWSDTMYDMPSLYFLWLSTYNFTILYSYDELVKMDSSSLNSSILRCNGIYFLGWAGINEELFVGSTIFASIPPGKAQIIHEALFLISLWYGTSRNTVKFPKSLSPSMNPLLQLSLNKHLIFQTQNFDSKICNHMSFKVFDDTF